MRNHVDFKHTNNSVFLMESYRDHLDEGSSVVVKIACDEWLATHSYDQWVVKANQLFYV